MNSATAFTANTQLTDEQLEAVESDAPALVVMSPAGTGKTEVLVQRAERYMSTPANKYKRVLVVTYTTRAASEFTARLRHQIGTEMERVTAGTLHSFCQTLLSVHGSHIGLPLDFQVITKDEDRAELFARYDTSWCIEEDPQLFRDLDLARARGDEHPQLEPWRSALRDAGAVDYAEMLTAATDLLRIPALAITQRNIYGTVLIDEAQNLTPQQYEFITALIGHHSESKSPQVSTTLLGDPNQLVTGFAGGDSHQMELFASEFGAQRLQLSRNFRSSHRLACLEKAVARKLDSNGSHRENGVAGAVDGIIEIQDFRTEVDEGEFVAEWVTRLLTEGLPPDARTTKGSGHLEAEDIAVLARHASSLCAVADALPQKGHAIAQAHNGDDLMSTPEGKVALLLMKSRSDRHRIEATAELLRTFQIELKEPQNTASNEAHGSAPDALQTTDFEHLAPLLCADSPATFMNTLEACRLPESASDELLSGWSADCTLIKKVWTEFKGVTPVSERSWTRFALHFDRMARGRDLGPGIRLLTVHKAQAREFKAVAILAMNEGQFPDFRATTSEQQQAELQTFYVAATRASRVLLLTRARERPTRYGNRSTEPSRFLQLAKGR